jgi:hypothetical protein
MSDKVYLLSSAVFYLQMTAIVANIFVDKDEKIRGIEVRVLSVI